MDETVAERFWAKVDKGGGNGCWLWTGARFENGYGQTCLDGRRARAHRVAYVLTHGAIPDDCRIYQNCANRLCCKPDHLLAQTVQDKMRLPRRERGPRKKLTMEQVRAIIQSKNPWDLAKRFGCSYDTINRVRAAWWDDIPRRGDDVSR